jgi:hypothetical protein
MSIKKHEYTTANGVKHVVVTLADLAKAAGLDPETIKACFRAGAGTELAGQFIVSLEREAPVKVTKATKSGGPAYIYADGPNGAKYRWREGMTDWEAVPMPPPLPGGEVVPPPIPQGAEKVPGKITGRRGK